MKIYYLTLMVLFSFTQISQAQIETILLDFGNTGSPLPWNNINDPDDGVYEGLLNHFGLATDIAIAVVDSFNSINSSGTQMADPALDIPGSASGDSFYGNLVFFGNDLQPTAGVQIYNLDPNVEYEISVFSSRLASDNRETRYIASGASIDTAFLDVADNLDSIVVFNLYPAVDGTIDIMATAGPNNTNSFGFYYLGVMKISYPGEPAGPHFLEIVNPDGGEYWQSGKLVDILWESSSIAPSILEYSQDSGNSWETIDTVPAFQRSYEWNVPMTPSEECLIRVSSDTLSDISQASFEISTDQDSCLIVVIGSSTAAGAGASTPDSAWVNRYRSTLYQNDTRYPVLNLAKGGYTSYHLLPDWAVPPPNITITIDSSRNISQALSSGAAGVIINLPSNDAANNFPVEDQLNNFALMVDEAVSQGVPVWVCTTQPRNFGNPAQVELQETVRDSIFSIYGDYAIDFWNGIADTSGHILSVYDSGDGVHLNDSGHRLLVERVLGKELDTLCLPPVPVGIKELKIESGRPVQVYPNPFTTEFQVVFQSGNKGSAHLVLFNQLGEMLQETRTSWSGLSEQQLHLQVLEQGKSSMYYIKLTIYENDASESITIPIIQHASNH